MSGTTADYGKLTRRQQETWATGDFHEVAPQNVTMAEALCRRPTPAPATASSTWRAGAGRPPWWPPGGTAR
jgi:hypothetical protein